MTYHARAMSRPRPHAAPLFALFALVLAGLPGCTYRLLDQPYQVRESDLFLPPFFTSESSEDGSSYGWNALFWLIGEDVESDRRHVRALPFYWSYSAPPFRDQLLVFPFYFSRTTAIEQTRFFSILYGYNDSEELRSDYVLPPLFYKQSSKTRDAWRSGFLFLYDWNHLEDRDDVVFLSLLGLVTGFSARTGLPPEGESTPALGREHSRAIEVLDVLGLVTLFGYDDVGDRREVRFLTLASSEPVSLFRSWRGRADDDPFVREWLFPLYMNVGDEEGGWHYVGPLWGGWEDTAAGTETDWWLAGLLARNRDGDDSTWRFLGIPVWWADGDDDGDGSDGSDDAEDGDDSD